MDPRRATKKLAVWKSRCASKQPSITRNEEREASASLSFVLGGPPHVATRWINPAWPKASQHHTPLPIALAVMEQNLRGALSISNGEASILVGSPITIGLWVAAALMLVVPIGMRVLGERRGAGAAAA